MANTMEIGPAESGQKLGRFLERRLNLPRALVYRWLRGGQVRVNGKRAKPERILEAGDVLRLPPWAESGGGEALRPCPVERHSLGADLEIVFQDDDILVLDKPYGLPVHGGTRHKDSLAARLKAACSEGFYVPAPAHRLDLQASGLIMAGKTHAAQIRLHAFFREAKYELEREYLCWVRGDASLTFAEPVTCVDFLAVKRDAKDRERVFVINATELADFPDDSPEAPKEARAIYHCLELRRHEKFGPLSLIRARLLTGRKHQIRAQLAARAFPLLGDWRYGGTRQSSMMLHAWRVTLPPGEAEAPRVFTSIPPWDGFFAVPKAYLEI